MNLRSAILSVVLASSAGSLSGADLALPAGARLTVERPSDLDSFDAPVGVFDAGTVPTRSLEGAISRTAWRIDTGAQTPLQIVAPLRAQIEALGYKVVFECESRSCGGFDFRFAIEVLPGPNMYVNIASYRYLTAFKGPEDNPTEALTVLASTSAASAYVQIISVVTDASIGATPEDNAVVVPGATEVLTPGRHTTAGSDNMLTQGFVLLSDLSFASGTSVLGPGPFQSLARLAETLEQRPDLRIALVGHTDTVGGLDANITLSRDRARAVRSRLIEAYGIDASRLDAEGMGYLAPIAPNLTPEGRRQNRRVEAIVLNVE